MNKVLVKIFFLRIDKQYEVWIPLNKRIYDVIVLLLRGVNELHDGIYKLEEIPILYNRATGEHYDLNSIIQSTNIKNGTELLVI